MKNSNMKKIIVVFLFILNYMSCHQNIKSPNNKILENIESPNNKISEDIESPNIKISEICLPKDDGTYMKLELTGNKGYYKYSYKNLMIDILYYEKKYNGPYDDVYDDVNINYMRLFEQYNNGEIVEMPEIIWHQNIRQNIINDNKYFDAFIFSAHEYTFKNLIRILYLILSDYYIRIRITPVFDNAYDREILFENIYEETPQYFNFDPEITFYGKKVLGWDRDKAINFGNDLLSGLHGSKIVNSWFNETEEILKMIQYE